MFVVCVCEKKAKKKVRINDLIHKVGRSVVVVVMVLVLVLLVLVH